MSSPREQQAPPFTDPPPSLGDPGRPLPAWVWLVLALLVSLLLFLALRLAVLRWAVTVGPPAAPGDAAARRILRPHETAAPPSSPEHFRQLVEGWRRAWVAQDLTRYLGYYSRNFGSQGLDRSEWAEHKARAFAAREPIEVEVRALRSTVRQSIAVVSFAQVYRSRGHEDRGVKILHLVPEDGAWRIFNEEWSPAGGSTAER